MVLIPMAAQADDTAPPKHCGETCAQQIVVFGGGGCVLGTDGGVSCWNMRGQPNDRTKPRVRKIEGLPPVKSLWTSDSYATCAVTRVGDVYCWGLASKVMLAEGEKDEVLVTPRKIQGFTKVESVALSPIPGSMCAVLRDGTVECMGYSSNNWGSEKVRRAKTPTKIPELTGVKEMHLGDAYSCFLYKSGEVKCAGENYWAELGIGTEDGVHLTPVDVPGIGHATSLSLSASSANCATNRAGEVHCWGRNLHGEHGDGTTDKHLSPVRVDGIEDARAVSVGTRQACAVTGSGEVYCWGKGILGDGKSHASPMIPQKVESISNATGIVSGHSLSCARVKGQIPWCWGGTFNNASWETSTGEPLQMDWKP